MTRSLTVGVTYRDEAGNEFRIDGGDHKVRLTIGQSVVCLTDPDEVHQLHTDVEAAAEAAFGKKSRT